VAEQRQPPSITEDLNELDGMAWRVLRNTTLRALVHPKPTGEVPEDEKTRRLDPFTQALQHDCVMFREAFKRAYLLGVERVHAELHGQPGVDDEMLGEAVEFHSKPQDTDAEAMKP
jgi:hypothetical protein